MDPLRKVDNLSETRFEVTQSHIDAGRRGSCYHCPVGLALRDCGAGFYWVAGYHVIRCQDKELDYATSRRLCDMISAYDSLGPMYPCTIILDHETMHAYLDGERF